MVTPVDDQYHVAVILFLNEVLLWKTFCFVADVKVF